MAPTVFRFWDCCVSQCSAAAAIDVGACERCMQHFCAYHVSSPVHSCEVSYLTIKQQIGLILTKNRKIHLTMMPGLLPKRKN